MGPRAATVAFAMNAGMYDEAGLPIGLAVAEGKELKPVNRRNQFVPYFQAPNTTQVYGVRWDFWN